MAGVAIGNFGLLGYQLGWDGQGGGEESVLTKTPRRGFGRIRKAFAASKKATLHLISDLLYPLNIICTIPKSCLNPNRTTPWVEPNLIYAPLCI